MLVRWKGLANVLEHSGAWTEDQRRLSLDLLATPLELRTDTALDGLDLDGRKALVAAEIAQLEKRQVEVLDARDLAARTAAAAGIGAEADPDLRRLRRYESSCKARQTALLKQFKKYRPGMASDIPPFSSESIERAREEMRAEKALIASRVPMPSMVLPPLSQEVPAPDEWFNPTPEPEPESGVSLVALTIGRSPVAADFEPPARVNFVGADSPQESARIRPLCVPGARRVCRLRGILSFSGIGRRRPWLVCDRLSR